MNLNELKEYLEFIYQKELEQKKLLQQEYANIKNITELSKKQIKEIKREMKIKRSLVRRIVPISDEKVLAFYKEQEINKVEIKLSKLISNLDELSNAINAIRNNRIVKPIYPNESLIALIIDYSIKNNINPHESLKTIIEIFNNNPILAENKQKEAMYNLEKSITSIFDENGKIDPECSFTTAKFNLNKLFEMCNVNINKSNVSVFINLLYKDLEIDFYDNHIIETKKMQETLNKEKEALSSLRKYFDGSKIIASCNQKEFDLILKNLNFDNKTKEVLSVQMKEYNRKINNNKRQGKLISVCEKYITSEEKELLLQTIRIIEDNNTPEIVIIDRVLKDIISICRYMNLSDLQYEYNESMEILSVKLDTLKTLIKNHMSPNINYVSNYLFLSDDNNIPYLLSDLGAIEQQEYYKATELLKNINTDDRQVFNTVDDEELYLIEGNGYSLFYTEHNGSKVLIKLVPSQYKDRVLPFVNSHLEDLKKMYVGIDNDKEKNISGIQAKLIDIELDITNGGRKQTLAKKINK